MYAYFFHGLNVVSEIPIPLLEPADQQGAADLTIHYGDIDQTLDDFRLDGDITIDWMRWGAKPGLFFQDVEGIGKYLARNGREIIISPLPGAGEDDILFYALGSCFASILHQRGLLPMHAGSVLTDQGALLLTGASGLGKSTLSTALAKKGYGYIADDISSLEMHANGEIFVRPALPYCKLWDESVDLLDLDKLRGTIMCNAFKKYKFTQEKFVESAQRVSHVVALQQHRKGDDAVRAGPLAFKSLLDGVYRAKIGDAVGRKADQFKMLGKLASQAHTIELSRHQGQSTIDEMIEQIEAFLKSTA